jgi:hypothetical protein
LARAKQAAKLPGKLNLIAALRDQQFQLQRLLGMQLWSSATPKAALEEIEVEVLAIKAVLVELEQLIANQKLRNKDAERTSIDGGSYERDQHRCAAGDERIGTRGT